MQKILKQIILTGAISCCSLLTFAQGAYLKIGGGYNFGMGSLSNANVTRTVTIDPQTNASRILESAQRVKLNYGKGITGNIAFGYLLKKGFGAEIEADYLEGGKNENRYKLTYSNMPNEPWIREYKSCARMLLLQPALIYSANMSGPFDFYGKFGVLVANGYINTNAYILDQDQGSQERIIEAQYNGGWGFGFMSAVGASYKLNEKLAIFSEIKMNNLSYSPKRYWLIKETLNGQDITGYRQKLTELVNSYSISYSNESSISLKDAFPFGSVGINFGLKYNF